MKSRYTRSEDAVQAASYLATKEGLSYCVALTDDPEQPYLIGPEDEVPTKHQIEWCRPGQVE